ncbi:MULTISPECIES: hypothetical protein [unclassified Halomonas]|uniref:hypothetical protein n=1 Tax=unclassified Halomonas TaxID=2609666 RepID=UPI0020A0A682|nr:MULTISPECIES: hypothetical protein [unclassified Halomonas]MCP1312992.1 hypothetical protein [Halomonas sp. 707D7]MCP1326161.1 hypothetical protein [Halomonas sp. 707D4]
MFKSISTSSVTAVDYLTTVEMVIEGELRIYQAAWSRFAVRPISVTQNGAVLGSIPAPSNPFDRVVEDAVLELLAIEVNGMPASLVALVIEHADMLHGGRGRSPLTRQLMVSIGAEARDINMELDATTMALCGDRRYFSYALERSSVVEHAVSASTGGAMMRVVVASDSYNERRHGVPWIARVTAWRVGKRPEQEFGGYVGSAAGGEAEVQARPGDIVRWGQKDYRNPRRSTAHYGIVMDDGSVELLSVTEARAAFDGRS